jgi:hypothetical protein
MPFLDAALPLLGQLAKHLSQVPAKLPEQHLAPVLRNEVE